MVWGPTSSAMCEAILGKPTGDGALGGEIGDALVEVEVLAQDARTAGLFHPNCRHRIGVYVARYARVYENADKAQTAG